MIQIKHDENEVNGGGMEEAGADGMGAVVVMVVEAEGVEVVAETDDVDGCGGDDCVGLSGRTSFRQLGDGAGMIGWLRSTTLMLFPLVSCVGINEMEVGY